MKKCTFLFLLFAAASVSAEKIDFVDNDWEKARAEAKAQNKYLFVDAYTDWCSWCKVMDKNTFSKEHVAEFMNKNFVSLKLEMERNYGIRVAMKYRVASFPSYLVFDPEGQLVYRLSGYMEAQKFLDKMNEALTPEKQKNYPGVSNQVELDYPDFYANSFGLNGKRSFPEASTLEQYFDQQNDWYSEVNFSVIARFSMLLADKHRRFFLENQDRYAGLYGKDDVQEIVSGFAYSELKKAIKDSSEFQLQQALTFVDKYVRENPADLKNYYRIHYYKNTGNWAKFAECVDTHLKHKNDENEQTINGWAWDVFEKAEAKEIVEKALGWMKPIIDTKPKYYSTDTYAALLFKSGKLKEAEKYALKAIELGKAENEKTTETEDLLEKIKKAKKK